MNKCSYHNCQYKIFLEQNCNENIIFFEDNANTDSYCIFHAPQKIKENFRFSQIALFEKLTFEYIEYIKNSTTLKYINFSNVIFTNISFVKKEYDVLDLNGYEVDFSDAIFLKNIRIDNIKCKKLIFKDSIFLDGGGIKNRKEDKNLQIEELIFKPYRVDSDFVIDIGQYINRATSLIEMKQGIIKKIQFENHKIGVGYLFFIGINEYTEEAHFENMLLDKVYFQNCDLSNCYFLNAKIENTEFRNCEFPVFEDYKLKKMNMLKNSNRFLYLISFLVLVFLILLTVNDFFRKYIEDIILNIALFTPIISLILGILFIISPIFILIIIQLFLEKILIISQTFFSLKHTSVADEKRIYKAYKEDNKKNLANTLNSLFATYNQLKNNFKDKDFQKSGDFFLSQRLVETLVKKNFLELSILKIHETTNGFGEKFIRALILFSMTIFIFTFLFKSLYKANIDYISTVNTPLYFIVNSSFTIQKEINTTLRTLNYQKSFIHTLEIENMEKKTVHRYNLKGNYNFKSQYLLKLKNGWSVAFVKSLSNMAYPFSIGTKKWFLDISKGAFFASIIEMFLLWYFAGAFILALWHRIKR